jgi:hypothetical protein
MLSQADHQGLLYLWSTLPVIGGLHPNGPVTVTSLTIDGACWSQTDIPVVPRSGMVADRGNTRLCCTCNLDVGHNVGRWPNRK